MSISVRGVIEYRPVYAGLQLQTRLWNRPPCKLSLRTFTGSQVPCPLQDGHTVIFTYIAGERAKVESSTWTLVMKWKF